MCDKSSGDAYMHDRLIAEFAEGYMEKLFYFCLKKVGEPHEAEDLASDITLQVISALNGGKIPQSFSAWVWQIARNRYAAWADVKRRARESFTGDDISELELADDGANTEDDFIRGEQMRLLRRELAFISSEYRHIVVAYYLENKRIKDIAAELNLPEGTVKSKLSRARTKLKEGINMAREFGQRSYKPENCGFVMNGRDGKNGEPYCYLNRAICKNILLEAYRTPSTAEEMSIELGVALPYMEEELNELVRATLLRKTGAKYETAFPIISAEAQKAIYAHLKGLAPEYAKSVINTVEFCVNSLDEYSPGWHEGYQGIEDMRWALLMTQNDIAEHKAWNEVMTMRKNDGVEYEYGTTVRPNGGAWDIIGEEAWEGENYPFVGCHGCMEKDNVERNPELGGFSQFKFYIYGISGKTPEHLTAIETMALLSVIKGEAGDVDAKMLERLCGYGYLVKTADGYKPTFLVMFKDKKKPEASVANEREAELTEISVSLAKRHLEFCRKAIEDDIPDRLKSDGHAIDMACNMVFGGLRGAVLEESLNLGYISYDPDVERKGLGAVFKL